MEITALILLYLIIGHLVGDFFLQPSGLVAYKQKSIYGILLHALIILIAQSLLLLPYLNSFKVASILIGIGVLHFAIDYAKIKIKKWKELPIIPFLLDQITHFIVIFGAYWTIKNETPVFFKKSWWFDSLYENTTLLVYFAGVIFFSYTLDIAYLTFKLQKNPNYQYKRGYFDMLLRVAGFALIYIGYSIIIS